MQPDIPEHKAPTSFVDHSKELAEPQKLVAHQWFSVFSTRTDSEPLFLIPDLALRSLWLT
jgi:hypothetical protein